jgi:hypothetical protein
MIDWVPINDWESDGKESYLALVDVENPLNRVVVLSTSYKTRSGCIFTWCGRKVTHCAKINFPVEKTLEEKFEQSYNDYLDCNSGSKKLLFGVLAQIAKEHYEGKE